MLPFNINADKIIKYIVFHSSELIAIGIIILIYLLIRGRIKHRISLLLNKITEKNRRYFYILNIFYSFPFLFIVFSYVAIPFLKTNDIFSFLMPIFWSLFLFYILNYMLSTLPIYEKFPFFKKILFFIIATILFYYYLSKPTTSPVYWLLYPLFSMGGKAISAITLIVAIIILYVIVYIAKFTKELISKRLTKDLHMEKNRAYNLSVIWEYLIITLGVLFSLNIIGVRLSSLLIIAGSLGVGIGFGLQTIVNNFISGLVLLTDRSINVGDIITIDSDMGKVAYVGARYTLVKTFDHQDLLIPNYKFMENKVTNWTRSDLSLRLHIPFSVSYNANPKEVEGIILSAILGYPEIAEYPKPEVLFLEFGESSLNFELLVWIPDLTQGARKIKSNINYIIFDTLSQHGIEIPYPQLDVHIRDK